MVDYHVHSDYSVDALGGIRDYCLEARRLGLEEICFTPHFEIDPVRRELDDRVNWNGRFVPMRSDWINAYITEIEQARAEFAPMKVRLGLEVGYDPAIEQELADYLARYPFDYVLGSIHCIDHVAITAHDEQDCYYARATAGQATEGYFELLSKAIASRLFDALGHIDVFKRYGAGFFGDELIRRARPYWPQVFASIVQAAPLTIELNTSGLRHAPAEPYPGEEILKAARAAGLEYIAIGSDAHRLQHLGFGLEQGHALAQRLGLKIARYERRRVLRD